MPLSEEDTKRLYITPALENAGLTGSKIKMEYAITDGRVIFRGKLHTRKKNHN